MLFVRKPAKVSSPFIATHPPTHCPTHPPELSIQQQLLAHSNFQTIIGFVVATLLSFVKTLDERKVRPVISSDEYFGIDFINSLIIVFAFRFGVFIKTALPLIIRKMNRCRVAFSLAVLALITKL